MAIPILFKKVKKYVTIHLNLAYCRVVYYLGKKNGFNATTRDKERYRYCHKLNGNISLLNSLVALSLLHDLPHFAFRRIHSQQDAAHNLVVWPSDFYLLILSPTAETIRWYFLVLAFIGRIRKQYTPLWCRQIIFFYTETVATSVGNFCPLSPTGVPYLKNQIL